MNKLILTLCLVSGILVFCGAADAGLLNAGFESNDASWVFSRNGDITAGRTSSWSSEGSFSYEFYRNTGRTYGSYYGQITQSDVDFTSVTSIMFDCMDKGIDVVKLEFYIGDDLIGTYTNNGHTDGGTSWGSTAVVYDIEFVLANQYSGLHDFTIRMQETGDYNPGDAKYYTVDNIRLVPEPATLSLLALGGLGVLRRKKH